MVAAAATLAALGLVMAGQAPSANAGPGTAGTRATTGVSIALGGASAPTLTLRVALRSQTPASIAAAARRAGPGAADVSIGGELRVPPIPGGFLGLSIEYPAVPAYAEAGPLFDQALANLTPGQRPVIRVGGDSADHAWVPVPGAPRNFGLWDALTPHWLASLRQLAQSTAARMAMGLDLEANERSVPVAEAHAFRRTLGRSLAALELGNEPDLYTAFPWYERHGRLVFARTANWSPRGYLSQIRALRPALGRTALWGPALTSGSRWWQSIASLAAATPHLSTITDHLYGTNCYGSPTSAHWPTVANLLAPTASAGLVGDGAPAISFAHASHRAIRIDEINTVSCAGARALPSFAAALWSLETGFALARAGVNGINIQTFPTAATRLFSFVHAHVSVADEYYGWMLFARAAPPRARLLATTTSANPHVLAFATRSGGVRHVVLINDSFHRPATVTLSAPGSTQAVVEPLRGPGMTAAGPVSFAGLRIAATSAQLAGRPTLAALAARGRYSVWLPPASADLITLTR